MKYILINNFNQIFNEFITSNFKDCRMDSFSGMNRNPYSIFVNLDRNLSIMLLCNISKTLKSNRIKYTICRLFKEDEITK